MKHLSIFKRTYYFLYEFKKEWNQKLIFKKFKKLSKHDKRFKLNWNDRYLFCNDATNVTEFEPHYIYHPAWATRVIKEIHPPLHIDFSSTLAFVSTLSAFIQVDFYDYRPANLFLSDLNCKQADLTQLPFEDASISCMSCMHVIEHIGLGRYGDPLDPEGDVKAINELKRVLKPGGNLILVTPVGKQRVQWNAHRIYNFDYISSFFKEGYVIKEFALIPDDALKTGIKYNTALEEINAQEYGCGCWWIQKL